MNEVPFHKIFEIPLRNGLTRPSSVRGAGISFVNMGEIFAYDRLSNQNMELVQVSEAEKSKYLLRSGDLLFARQSLKWDGAGKVSIFVGSSETTFESHLIRARLNSKIADPRFYYYFFRSSAGRTVMESIIEQVAAAGIRGSDLANLPVPLPPLSYQRQVADTLWAFEDKIDHNQLQCGLLEEMSQALFKSWFVDFDPVVAKSEGRKPFGMSDDIAALFPDSFEESELGAVPKGWRVESIYKVTAVDYGAPYASSRFNTNKIGKPIIRIRDLSDHSPDTFTDEDHPRAIHISAGDIVTGMDGEFRAHLWKGPESVLNQRLCRFRPHRVDDTSFMLEAVRPLLADIERTEVGTTVIHLGKSDIDRFRIVLPPAPLLDAFSQISGPLIRSMLHAARQSGLLVEARNALLPHLLSGESGENDLVEHKVTEATAA